MSISPALILLAFLIPNTTGREFKPSFESPSTLLKSLILQKKYLIKVF